MKKIKYGVFLPPFILLIAAVVYNFIDSGGFAAMMINVYYVILNKL